MALPNAVLRHPWQYFELMGLSQGSVDDYLTRLRRFYHRNVFSVAILDFESIGRIDGGNVVGRLYDRLEMVHRGADDQVIFRSHTWERLFRIEELLVKVLMLEFFSTV